MEGDPFKMVTLSSVKEGQPFWEDATTYLQRCRALHSIARSVRLHIPYADVDLEPEDARAFVEKGFKLEPVRDYDGIHRTRWRISWE